MSTDVDSTALFPLLPTPPAPMEPGVQHQWDHTRLRRRMLYGLWKMDLLARLQKAMGTKRATVHGDPDLSANTFSATMAAGAALYDQSPRVTRADGSPGLAVMTGYLEASGLWAQMQRTQRDVLGMREMLIRVDVRGPRQEDGTPDPDRVEVRYTPVPVDMVVMEPDPSDPERPIALRHAVLRDEHMAGKPEHTTGKQVWTWDVWDLRGEPTHKVTLMSGPMRHRDVSDHYGLPPGGLVGDAYPARRNGRPVIPYTLYHAARTGCLLDSYHGIELVEGALNVGVLWTFFGHCVRNASWPQRYTLGASPAAGDLVDQDQAAHIKVTGDPAAVVQLERSEDFDGQPIISQWTTSTDPMKLAEAIGLYERRLAAFAGLNPADVQRVSGDPRSGYALAISREGRREAQRRYGPIFRPADEELIGLTAALINGHLGRSVLPEDGWRVEYREIPLSTDELSAQRQHVMDLLDRGLIDANKAREMLGIEGAAVAESETKQKRLIGELTTVLDIVKAASLGEIPPESAKAQMRIMFNLEDEAASQILAGAGINFRTTKQSP